MLSDWTKIAAGLVISAADGRSTIFEMLNGRFVNKEIEDRYATWDVSPSTVIAIFGVARSFNGLPLFWYHFS